MSTSGETADQVVRMTLNGVEVAAKISGVAAKQLAVMLYAILKDQKRTKGKIRLSNMLRSGKELKVFAVQNQDLQRFCTEAKKYGVLYCVLRNKNAGDGLIDIMVRAEDASKINRIFERFKLATVDMASVKSEIEKTKTKDADIPDPEKTVPVNVSNDQLVDELMKSAPGKEESQTQNPTEARNAKSRQSEPTSKPSEKAARGTSESEARSLSSGPQRTSVRDELNEIKAQQKQKADLSAREKPEQEKPAQHKAPPKKKSKSQKMKER